MAQNIELSKESVAILERFVADGTFDSIEAAAEHAVRQLEIEETAEYYEELARPALEQLERGEGLPYTPDLVKQAFDRARADFERMRLEKLGA